MEKAAAERSSLDRTVLQVHRHLGARLGLKDLPQLLAVLLGDHSGHQSLLACVATEDVGEAGRQDDLEPVVLERPHGMLPRGARAEVRTGNKHRGPLVSVLIEDEVGLTGPPGGEQGVVEARAGDAFEIHRRDDRGRYRRRCAAAGHRCRCVE